MYIDVLTGLGIGLLILAARETFNYKKNKEATKAIADYKKRGREITMLTQKLKEADELIEALQLEAAAITSCTTKVE